MNKKPRLHRFEYARQGLLRITRLLAEEANTCAEREHPGPAEVHQVRLCCKRQRALLRLLLPSEEKPLCASQIKKIGAAARKLSSSRDQEVVRENLQKLAAKKKKGRFLRPFAFLLAKQQQTSREFAPEMVAQHLQQAAESLREAAETVRSVPLSAHGWSLLAMGLERSHRKAREAYSVAHCTPQADHLHELRKRLKDLLYQLEIVSPWWPDHLKSLRRQLAAVAEQLGVVNDLNLLEKILPDIAGCDSAQVLVPEAQSLLRKTALHKTTKALRLAGALLRTETSNWLARLERTRWRRSRLDTRADKKIPSPAVKARALTPHPTFTYGKTSAASAPAGDIVA